MTIKTEKTSALDKYLVLSFHTYVWASLTLSQQDELRDAAQLELTALREQVAKQTQCLHELTCKECDSRIMDDGHCMMGHWCGKPLK